ncbi:hypothetical protein ZOSMA_8G01230 [Zostera marina]|uniref:Uncharacterized protein n=1 Tax=Zostera marina TaxID=29655 RepID=A0A0K9NLK4_ZOSMR|nr:hypothetical protein ZOSMA_8G01230 [Zostera marina]
MEGDSSDKETSNSDEVDGNSDSTANSDSSDSIDAKKKKKSIAKGKKPLVEGKKIKKNTRSKEIAAKKSEDEGKKEEDAANEEVDDNKSTVDVEKILPEAVGDDTVMSNEEETKKCTNEASEKLDAGILKKGDPKQSVNDDTEIVNDASEAVNAAILEVENPNEKFHDNSEQLYDKIIDNNVRQEEVIAEEHNILNVADVHDDEPKVTEEVEVVKTGSGPNEAKKPRPVVVDIKIGEYGNHGN